MFSISEVQNLKPTERAQLVSVANAANKGKFVMIECDYTKQTDTTSRQPNVDFTPVFASKGKHAGLVQSVWKSKEGNWCLTLRDVARNAYSSLRLSGLTSFKKIGEVSA